MNVELITTGSELLLGRILNTHVYWLGRRLADLGLPLCRQVTVPDSSEAIGTAVQQALSRADLVITTGGLGPTSDDLTRERIAEILGRKLIYHPEAEASIRAFFESRKRPVPERTKVEAFAPEGATLFLNRQGTAPGLGLKISPNPARGEGLSSLLVLLPGPPRELHPMFDDQVRPWLFQNLPRTESFVCRTYKTTGLGESFMEVRLEPGLAPLVARGLELGYCARVGEVDVRFCARGADGEQLVHEASQVLMELAGEFVFGTGDDSLESCLVRRMTERGLTLALAESCTGGHLANRITHIPGASAVLLAGFVPYSNAAKTNVLGVPSEMLAEHGAVSEPVARALAEGARRVARSDYAIGITGIAGPGGGSEDKPVGTVFTAVAGPSGTTVTRHMNRFDRETFKFATAQQAFDQLRRRLDQGASSTR